MRVTAKRYALFACFNEWCYPKGVGFGHDGGGAGERLIVGSGS
jgi:hypothetical protein